MALNHSSSDLGDQADAEYMCRPDKPSERSEPAPCYNEDANGGRWWEKDLKEAVQDLYGEPTIYGD